MCAKFDGNIYTDVDVLALAALAGNDVVAATLKQDGSRPKGFRFMKTDYHIGITGLTAGEGPIVVGIGGPAMDAAEIEEAIQADPQGPDDRPAVEQSMRPFWILGMGYKDTDGGKLVIEGTVNMRWSFPESAAQNIWVYNLDSGALTTGAQIHYMLKHFGVWLND